MSTIELYYGNARNQKFDGSDAYSHHSSLPPSLFPLRSLSVDDDCRSLGPAAPKAAAVAADEPFAAAAARRPMDWTPVSTILVSLPPCSSSIDDGCGSLGPAAAGNKPFAAAAAGAGSEPACLLGSRPGCS